MASALSNCSDETYCSEAELKYKGMTRSQSKSSQNAKKETDNRKLALAKIIETDIHLHIRGKKIMRREQVCNHLRLLKRIKCNSFHEYEFVLKLKRQLNTILTTFKNFTSNCKKIKPYKSSSLTQEMDRFKNMGKKSRCFDIVPKTCMRQISFANNNEQNEDLEDPTMDSSPNSFNIGNGNFGMKTSEEKSTSGWHPNRMSETCFSQLTLTNNNFETGSLDLTKEASETNLSQLVFTNNNFVLEQTQKNNVSLNDSTPEIVIPDTIPVTADNNTIVYTQLSQYTTYRNTVQMFDSDPSDNAESDKNSPDQNADDFENIIANAEIMLCDDLVSETEPESQADSGEVDIMQRLKKFKIGLMNSLTELARQKRENPMLMEQNAVGYGTENDKNMLKFNVTREQQEINWKILASLTEEIESKQKRKTKKDIKKRKQ